MKFKLFNLIEGRCSLCLGKTKEDSGICSACINDLPINRISCSICCKPLPTSSICGDCLKYPPKYYDRILSPFIYDYPMNKLISRIKFQQDLKTARSLALICAHWFRQKLASTDKPDMLLPIPLHKQRLRQRGYNQSIVLAKPICTSLNIPMQRQQYQRIINTQAQSNLKAKERRKNVRGAFQCDLSLKGKHIAIFDDVITTGATSEAFAKTLKEAGAEKVEIWSCCRG